MEKYHDKIRSLFNDHIMFSRQSEEDKKALEGLCHVRELENGEILAEQFTPMYGMFCVISGNVRIKQTVEGRRVFLGDLSPGATFGELSLVKECNWEFQFTAIGKVTLLVIPAEKLRSLLRERPRIGALFRQYIGRIQLSQRLKSLLGAGKYTPDRFSEMLSHLGVKKIPKGKPVFLQGDVDPRLYYIESGTVDLSKKVDEEGIFLDRCTKGELIGEGGALPASGSNGVQTYTASAVTDVTVVVVNQAEAAEIFEINRDLSNQLLERSAFLTQTEKEQLDALDRAKGVDLRIKLAESVTEEEFRRSEREKDLGKFTVLRQGDESECGAACLAMITRHYGKDFRVGQIKELSNVSTAYASPINIITGAENLGYNAKSYALTFNDLKKVRLPGIIGWEGLHYAVVYRVSKGKVYLVDPLDGQKVLDRDEFITGWTSAEVPGMPKKEEQGLFIALNPTVKFQRLEPPKRPIYHFLSYLLPYKKYFFEAFLAALVINLLVLATPLFIQTIVDTVVVHKDVSLLNMMLGGMALVTLFSTLTMVVQRLLLAHTTARLDMRLMSEFYRHTLSLPLSFFLTRNKGEILARFGENAKIRAILTGSTITVVLNILLLTIYFLMMFAYNIRLTFIVIAFIPGYVGLILFFTPRIKALAQKIFLTTSQAQGFLIEALNGIETLKATANEYMARARWENAFVEKVNYGFKQAQLILISTSLQGMLRLASNVIILWYGANQVIAGAMSIGELMGFNMLVTMVMNPVQQFVQLWDQLQEVRISIDRVADILNVEPEQPIISSPDRMPAVLTECEGRIEFSKVNFSYLSGGKENLVMKDFDLMIEPGEHVALVGPSGCGKSTMVKMILGFNLPRSGECKVDGKSIVDLDIGSLRRHIGVVLQDSFLLSGTVAENIALGDPEPDMMAVKTAAKLAGIDGVVLKWPMGYQTPLGEKGMGISGGQRQRVCIARALYRQPKILIFDEATSALDNESEKLIQSHMREILKGRTSITVAHRLSTIVDAGKICFISNGRVAETGTHNDLTNPEYLRENGYPGLYYNLARDQFNLPPLKQ
ncbi:MAG: ABC transporter transmembrane domain-containing protein [Pseudomonadota bacterium]